MPKRKRWVCPICKKGKLGLQRPRLDNIIRYCLDCSKETKKLVKRICPADETKKEKKKASSSKPKTIKPRKTKRSWMNDDRYLYEVDGSTINLMEATERMIGYNWDFASYYG